MKHTLITEKNFTTSISEFNNLNDFDKYLCNTPFNEAFHYGEDESLLCSIVGNYDFTNTENFDEAKALMRDGWADMAFELNAKLNKLKVNTNKTVNKRKVFNSVSGFQPIVPLYLSGVPTNMVQQKLVPVKQKIVNITKCISYPCTVSTSTIIEESVKALQIVKKIEELGYRVNLSVVMLCESSDTCLACKVLIKKSTEKVNVSKLAFPLVHPSFLRRMMFRYIEVCPDTTSGFVHGYGRPSSLYLTRKTFKDDIVLPPIFDCNIEDIEDITSLECFKHKN